MVFILVFQIKKSKTLNNMKYAVIIDSYPQSDIQRERLLNTLKKLKSKNIDVLLTSHNTCTPEIIGNSKYFLYEKENNYHFLDSHILNENIENTKQPTYTKYTHIGENIFYDNLVVTAWSVAIISQLFNSIKFLYSKGYNYAFYMVDDFNCPDDFEVKLNNIFQKLENKRNYFIKNQARFSSWFAGFFFGFTIDDVLINKIPNLDFSDNKTYQKYFPNRCGEDVVNDIWGNDDNLIEEHDELNNIFGIGNWNMDSSVIKPGPSNLHNEISSSIYVNNDYEHHLMLYVPYDSSYNKVLFNFKLLDETYNPIYLNQIELKKGWYHLDNLTNIIKQHKILFFEKEIIGYSKTITYFKDLITLNNDNIEEYKKLKIFNSI
jgi:hypothetical protein